MFETSKPTLAGFPLFPGVRIETTHVPSQKRKYTVWGLSSYSAERLQFDVQDETTGHQTKTTVAQYFKDRYKWVLRYNPYQSKSMGLIWQIMAHTWPIYG